MKDIVTTILSKLVQEGKIDMISINLEQFEELLNEELEKRQKEFEHFLKVEYQPASFDFNFRHDWDSFIFWKKMNWRDFTWIKFHTETNSYSHYFEFEFAILGFHFSFDWCRPIGEKPSDETNKKQE